MRILVDADACPVIRQIERVAVENGIDTILYCDTNHILDSAYSKVCTIGAGADAVDFALLKHCRKGDLVVTQDYGLAALILAKGAYGLHPSGRPYTSDNIDELLMARHIAKVNRRKQKHHLKGPAKRSAADDENFVKALENIIGKII